MKPEDLEKLAEYMGYEKVVIAKDTKPHKVFKYLDDKSPTQFRRDEYNPLNNAEQCLELMEKLKIAAHFWNGTWRACEYSVQAGIGIESEGKSVNEAITLTAIAAIKEE